MVELTGSVLDCRSRDLGLFVFCDFCFPWVYCAFFFFFSSRRRHTRCLSDWSSDVCSSDLLDPDKSNGRIIRIAPRNFVRPPAQDLRKASTSALLGFLSHSNRWYREQARQMLAKRSEPMAETLNALQSRNDETALEALWVLNLRGEIGRDGWRIALKHANPHVRRWAVRLLGDRNHVEADVHAALVALAETESDAEVRSQLASSARRLPTGQALPVLRHLIVRDADSQDLHIPLLIWWAIESKADTGREE